jgi:hypothetical protein
LKCRSALRSATGPIYSVNLKTVPSPKSPPAAVVP